MEAMTDDDFSWVMVYFIFGRCRLPRGSFFLLVLMGGLYQGQRGQLVWLGGGNHVGHFLELDVFGTSVLCVMGESRFLCTVFFLVLHYPPLPCAVHNGGKGERTHDLVIMDGSGSHG